MPRPKPALGIEGLTLTSFTHAGPGWSALCDGAGADAKTRGLKPCACAPSVKLHGGRLEIFDLPFGGASLTLKVRLAPAPCPRCGGSRPRRPGWADPEIPATRRLVQWIGRRLAESGPADLAALARETGLDGAALGILLGRIAKPGAAPAAAARLLLAGSACADGEALLLIDADSGRVVDILSGESDGATGHAKTLWVDAGSPAARKTAETFRGASKKIWLGQLAERAADGLAKGLAARDPWVGTLARVMLATTQSDKIKNGGGAAPLTLAAAQDAVGRLHPAFEAVAQLRRGLAGMDQAASPHEAWRAGGIALTALGALIEAKAGRAADLADIGQAVTAALQPNAALGTPPPAALTALQRLTAPDQTVAMLRWRALMQKTKDGTPEKTSAEKPRGAAAVKPDAAAPPKPATPAKPKLAAAPKAAAPQKPAALFSPRDVGGGLSFVDLFCGCGGLSKGLVDAGWTPLAAYDKWAAAIEIYNRNIKDPGGRGHAVMMDLSRTGEVLAHLAKLPKPPDVVAGASPCQEFSSAGGRVEKRQAVLLVRFADVVSAVRPLWFLLENVEGASRSQAFADAVGRFQREGYAVRHAVIDANLCRVPQTRRRLICVGRRDIDDALFDLKLEPEAAPPYTARQHLRDIGVDLGLEAYYRHPRSYTRRAIYSLDEPAATIRGTNRPMPPNYPAVNLHARDAVRDPDGLKRVRALAAGERALLQTFPPDWRWSELGSAALDLMIGNAVPPRMAAHVGRAIAAFEARTLSLRAPQAA